MSEEKTKEQLKAEKEAAKAAELKRKAEERIRRREKFNKGVKTIYTILAIIAVIIFYFMFVPALNFQSIGMWFFTLFAIALILLPSIDFKDFFGTRNKVILRIVIFCAVAFLLALFVGTPTFGGMNSYRNRLTIPANSSFDEWDEFDSTQVQIVDKNVATSLADRVFGEMGAEVVSQFQISNSYSSVVVNNTMYRITPVEYSGFIKWLSTSGSGTPGYISVNVTTGDTEFHEVDEGLKFTQNAKMLHNLALHLRLSHPTCILGQTKFEVDDNWHPYWVTQVMKYAFVSKAEDVQGIIITDPCTGVSTYYDVQDVPSWVDNVYNPDLICEMYNSYGRFINGYFNLSQKGETATTDDYAYLQKDGHLWMYTGVTSVAADESNVGFIYVDLQNKNVIYIVSAGAEEYSARASAEGAVQEKGYTSVFPTMVKIEGEPVYFMGLKDNAGLIKAYAFVSYKSYQKVGIGSTVSEALKNYTGKTIITDDKTSQKEIEVKEIASAVVDGYSIYYILTIEDEVFSCSIESSTLMPFIKEGDVLQITYTGSEIVKVSK